MEWTIGANGQYPGGCRGNADLLGLTEQHQYYVQIDITGDCASGTDGCIYGCNGNVRFAVNGVEFAHFADCSSVSGMDEIAGGVLEPADNDITYEGDTQLYGTWSTLGSIQALLTDGTAPTPSSLPLYCYGFNTGVAPGAGAVIWSNTQAGFETALGQCPPGTVYCCQGGAPAASGGSPTSSGVAQRVPFDPNARLLGAPMTAPPNTTGRPARPPTTPRRRLPQTHVDFPGTHYPPPPGSGGPYVTVLPGTGLPPQAASATPTPAPRGATSTPTAGASVTPSAAPAR